MGSASGTLHPSIWSSKSSSSIRRSRDAFEGVAPRAAVPHVDVSHRIHDDQLRTGQVVTRPSRAAVTPICGACGSVTHDDGMMTT